MMKYDAVLFSTSCSTSLLDNLQKKLPNIVKKNIKILIFILNTSHPSDTSTRISLNCHSYVLYLSKKLLFNPLSGAGSSHIIRFTICSDTSWFTWLL